MEPYRQSVAPEHGPRIAAIGGGTGLSTLLRGLKRYTKNITASSRWPTTAAAPGGCGRTWGCFRREISATVWRRWPMPSP